MAKRKSKPKSPTQIAAEKARERRVNFEALGLQPEAANLPANEDVMIEREVRQSAGMRGNDDRARRLSGLDWLWQKQRLAPHQMQAGLKYAQDYMLATDLHLRSCISEVSGGDMLKSQERRVEAQKRIAALKREALNNHLRMISVVDAVAGNGIRVTTLANGDEAEAKKIEATLTIALDLLSANYGMISA